MKMIKNIFPISWFFVLLSILFFSNAQAVPGTPAEGEQDQLAAKDRGNKSEQTSFMKRIQVGVTGQWYRYQGLRETFLSSPVSRLFPVNAADGWQRDWEERKVYTTFSLDLIKNDRFLLRPGIHLGASQAKFSASHPLNSFRESWSTRETMVWGAACTTELRVSAKKGLFLRGEYHYFQSEADEKTESIESSTSRGNNPSERDAHFRWQTHEGLLGVGWRFGPFAPIAGMEYRSFSLKKRLRYHIVEANADLYELPIAQILNSEASQYRYCNRTTWQPFLGFDWKFHPHWALCARVGFSESPDYRVGLLFSF